MQGWKTKPNEADKPISQAPGERLREMAANLGPSKAVPMRIIVLPFFDHDREEPV